MRIQARRLGALILGGALALPLLAFAQGSPQPAASPTPPVTAQPEDKQKPVAPAAAPTPAPGSTAVPGWNNPPAWGAASERPQYASVPGVDTNRLIQGAGREWRAG